MTRELQSTLEASGIEWPALRNHIPCMGHVIHLALGAFTSSLGLKGRTKSWKAHERGQQFWENETIDIGKSQSLRKEGNARMNKVSAMKQGFGKTIEKLRISWYFEIHDAELHIAANACCIKYADTWSPKRVHGLSKSHSPHCGTSYYGCEDMLELYTGVAGARLPLTGIHPQVASKAKIHWISAIIHHSGWMDVCQVCHGSVQAISILDPLDVEEAYSHIASRCHSVQRHIRSHGWRDAGFGQEEDSMEGTLVLRCEFSSAEALQILRWCDTNDRHDSDFRIYPWSVLEVAIV